MDLDGAVTGGVGDAGKDESIIHLVVIKEGLFGLVDTSFLDNSSAGGAGSGTARVREFDSGLLGGVNDENVIGTLDGGVDSLFFGNKLDGVSELGAHGSLSGALIGAKAATEERERRAMMALENMVIVVGVLDVCETFALTKSVLGVRAKCGRHKLMCVRQEGMSARHVRMRFATEESEMNH